METLLICLSFVLIALSAGQIGRYFTLVRLPLISGFLFTGILAGPFVLDFISAEAVRKLHFIDQVSLAFIAFAAGSELYLKELKKRFISISWVTLCIVAGTFPLGCAAVFLLADYIPFMQEMEPLGKLAVAMLAGAILIARSPSSAIAVVNELRARGPFTQTVLGVTMASDVVVIVLFAINSSVADALLTGLGFSPALLIVLCIELTLSLLLSYCLAQLLQFILSLRVKRLLKTGFILLSGYGIFILSAKIRTITHAELPYEILLEPLLICMVGSFIATNYSDYRAEFRKILQDIGPAVYVVFFTLTGASLAIDILVLLLPIALCLVAVRLAGIFIGSFCGGMLAGDPVQHNRISWMTYVTQAGVGLGLAKQVAAEFPEWGTPFAALMIAVIIVNQLIGPILCKWAIHRAGEAYPVTDIQDFETLRKTIIFGLERQSIALARKLFSHGWQVTIAVPSDDSMVVTDPADIEIIRFDELNKVVLQRLGVEEMHTIVALLSDEENYRICEVLNDHFGTKNLIVRLQDRANFDRFHEMFATVVDAGSAFVSLLDQFVRSPAATSLLLGMEENQEIEDIYVRNPDLHGVPLRNLTLPLDTLVLSVKRNNQVLISHGYMQLETGDRVTVVGSPKSLKEVLLKFSG
ncbi:MAG: cation:proton antiporter [Thermodesulfobacteriota bacterium]|nr:cation:proton antiporter [Thermodesulfobacteriota bacterium]